VGTSSSPPSLYDAGFFDRQRDGSRRSAAIAVPLLIELFEPQSVIDVGCGTGVWLSVFREYGVDDILGIDGPWIERRQQEIPEVFFRECDLTQPVALGRTFDLALCLEVAEHLPSEAVPGLVESLTALAPVVVFSAAIPGQGGDGHINERWPSFWSSYFAARGYVCSTDLRRRLWSADAVEFWYRQNMLCFVAEARPDLIDRASRENDGSAAGPLDVVHPQLFLKVSSDLEWRCRDVDRLEREIQETRAELSAIKNSRAWRCYQSIRPMLVGARRVSSRFRISARNKAERSDASD
jgi:SAM-dependent methyltransferase